MTSYFWSKVGKVYSPRKISP